MRQFSPFEAIYTSPLKRAFKTAEIITEKTGLSVISDMRLKERNVGKMAGLTREEACRRSRCLKADCSRIVAPWILQRNVTGSLSRARYNRSRKTGGDNEGEVQRIFFRMPCLRHDFSVFRFLGRNR
ncbi:MAG: histidine phosphatase family protein [Candidatus Wallbacteria bacterium]|nr:histidine phosphatase family protein [Candidatus Wallbacteria bacterium]